MKIMKSYLTIIIDKLNQLRETRKSSFMSSVVSVIIVLVSALSVYGLNQEMELYRCRSLEFEYNLLLGELLQELYVNEERYILYSARDELVDFRMQKKIEPILEEIKTYYDDFCFQDAVYKRINLQAEWDKLKRVTITNQKDDIILQHHEFQEQIGWMIKEVISGSPVFPIDEQFILAQITVKILPELIYQLEKLRDISVAALENNILTEKEKDELRYTAKRVENELDELKARVELIQLKDGNLEKSDGEIQCKTLQDTRSIIDYVQMGMKEKEERLPDYKEYSDLAKSALEMNLQLLTMQMTKLYGSLEKKIKRLWWKRIVIVIFMGIALALTIYSCFTYIYSLRQNKEETLKQSTIFLYHYLFYPLMLDMERKYEEVEEELAEITRNVSFQILQAQEEERKAASRELHDGIGQLLYSMLIHIGSMKKEKDIGETVAYLQKLTLEAIEETRRLARSLRPQILDDLGLALAIQNVIEEFEQTTKIKVNLQMQGTELPTPPEIEIVLFRVCQEALTNISKHAGATEVKVILKLTEDEGYLQISDNGKGFDVVSYLRTKQNKGIGLFSMRERVRGVGGWIEMKSKHNQSTTITVRIPMKDRTTNGKFRVKPDIH